MLKLGVGTQTIILAMPILSKSVKASTTADKLSCFFVSTLIFTLCSYFLSTVNKDQQHALLFYLFNRPQPVECKVKEERKNEIIYFCKIIIRSSYLGFSNNYGYG